MMPSSADDGFFQEAPALVNQVHDDASFRRAMRLFLPTRLEVAVRPEIEQIGSEAVSQQIFSWVSDAERNLPYLRGSGRDAFGRWKGELVVGEGWRKLQEYGLEKGFVAAGYDSPHGSYSRVVQFFRLLLWEPSCASVTCPSAMQDGAARLLREQLKSSSLDASQRKVLQNAFDHLIARDGLNGWTSGQWMTERTGGSDVSQTETVARYDPSASSGRYASASENIPLGPWSVSGFKWFSSATDSAMTILLARTANGMSAFFAPMRRQIDSGDREGCLELNGVRIQRLKNKLGTRPVPTAELELRDMRAWLIGQEGQGIRQIAHVLTITRIHCATASLGYLGRSLSIAKAYALVRTVGATKGKRMLLAESPLHLGTLADVAAEYHGLLLMTMLVAYVLGLDEHDVGRSDACAMSKLVPLEKRLFSPLLRVLTPLVKAYVCKKAIPLIYECMEALGGVGYLQNDDSEYLNISRLYRDACVQSIWEGTTDVLSTDLVRAMKHPREGRDSLDGIEYLVQRGMDAGAAKFGAWDILSRWTMLRRRVEQQSHEELVGDARRILWDVAEMLEASVLAVDWASDKGARSAAIFDRFLSAREAGTNLASRGRSDPDVNYSILWGARPAAITSRATSKI